MSETAVKRILVVEDDRDAADMMKLVLESEGHSVSTAADAEQGMKKLRAEKPDLVLLDVMMRTGTEGFHFVWNLRKDRDAGCRDIPIIILSAIHQGTKLRFYPDQSDGFYQPYEYLPVQGFLDKPASPEQLVMEVKRVLAHPELPRSSRESGGR